MCNLRAVFLGSLATLMLLANSASAEDAIAKFYKGKQVRVIIGVGPGEAYDLYARLLVRHMPKHMPGNPTFVPHNQPGAGSLTAMNVLYNVAARDGTVIGTGNRFLPMMPLLLMEGARFDALKVSYIGSMNRETGVCVAMKSAGFNSLSEMTRREIIVGTVGAGAELTHFTATLRSMLGLKMKLIAGYRTSSDINAAMEKGELQGRCGVSFSGLKTTRPQWLSNGEVDILLQLGLGKERDLPTIPLITDLVADEHDRRALELMLAPAEWGRPFFAPPQLPPEHLAALRDAFDASMKDTALLHDAKRLNLDIVPMNGAEMTDLMLRLYNAPQEVIDRARRLAHMGE
jgi:tripartite-type tricarboxylate transporter receptor subunit TctC